MSLDVAAAREVRRTPITEELWELPADADEVAAGRLELAGKERFGGARPSPEDELSPKSAATVALDRFRSFALCEREKLFMLVLHQG